MIFTNRGPRIPAKNIRVIVVAVCVLYTIAGEAQDPRVQLQFQRGAMAMRNGRLADAESAFREAAQLAPQLPEAHLDLGLVLGREGKLDEAIVLVRHALTLDPDLGSAHMFLGIFLHQANRQEEARTELQQEIARKPDNVEALTWLGMVELAQGHPERAVGPFDHAAQLSPDDLNLLEYRGRAHNLVARDSYARMARLDPGSWHVHRVQAELYADEGRHADAITEYEAAIKLEARNPDLYEGLGDQYRKTSQLEAARKAYAKELELSPANPVAMYNLGSIEVELGNNAAGVSALAAMMKIYPGSAVAEYYLGRGLAAQGEDRNALTWLEKSAEADPSGEVGKRSYYELARLYRKLQRTPDAQTALQHYNQLREEQEKRSSQQVQDWRKLADRQTARSTEFTEQTTGRAADPSGASSSSGPADRSPTNSLEGTPTVSAPAPPK